MTQVLLLGGDVAAYVAALELAEVGVQVWIAGGAVRVPEYEVRDPGGQLTGLLRELASPLTPAAPATPGAAPQTHARAASELRARDGAWKPAPESEVWGIPTFPLAKQCIDLVGTRAAFRGYLDRIKPVLTIGKETNFGRLVESRLGSAVRNTMVEPRVFERFGVSAHEAEVALVEPGLNEALTRAGSLSGGALQQFEEHVARETVVEPAAGWHGFGGLLAGLLELYGAKQFDAEVRALEPASGSAGRPGEAGEAGDSGWVVTDGAGRRHAFDAVIGSLEEVAGPAEVTRAASAEGSLPADPTGAVHPARPADRPRPGALAEQLGQLAPARTRKYAEIGIQESSPGAGSDAAGERLFLVTSGAGETWAARSVGVPGGEARLRLSGPAAGPGATGGAVPVAEALEVLGVAADSGSIVERTRAAAFATAAEREAQQAAREELADAHPSLLVLGEALHGGDLGGAVEEARERAVRLRRKLTGISE